MDTKTSRLDDKKARYESSQLQPARLDKYTILELARIPSVARVIEVEDWLGRVYGKAAAPAKATSEGYARMQELNGFDKAQERVASETVLRARDGFWLLARQLRQRTAHSARCEVNNGMVEWPMYRWRKWTTKSV